MLTRPPCDVPQASFADTNAVGFIARHLRLPEPWLRLLDVIQSWRISVHRRNVRFIFPIVTRWENVLGMWLPVAAR